MYNTHTRKTLLVQQLHYYDKYINLKLYEIKAKNLLLFRECYLHARIFADSNSTPGESVLHYLQIPTSKMQPGIRIFLRKINIFLYNIYFFIIQIFQFITLHVFK